MKQLFLIFALTASVSLFAAEPVFVDARQFPLLGSVVNDTSTTVYQRLPDSLATQIRPELADLGNDPAGMSIRFASNSTKIALKWNSTKAFRMNHMTPTGISGLDLYALVEGQWTFVGSGRPGVHDKKCKSTVIQNMTPEMREYMLFLSLYDGVDSLYIGIDSTAVITAPALDIPRRDKPIVMYGTSILQGGCASRPGMAHTNILQRMLNREVYNLGFSGNGRLDVEIARLMTTIDAGLYVLDALPNNTTEQLKENIDPFFRILRDARPEVPILFVESPIFPNSRFDNEVKEALAVKNAALREYYDSLVASGETGIYYFEGERVFGDNSELTVDCNHFTDYGFQHFATQLAPILQNICK